MGLSLKEIVHIADIINLKKTEIGLFFLLCLGQRLCVHAQEPVFERNVFSGGQG